MVLAKNKAIVSDLHSIGGRAVGLCGKDGNMIEVTKKTGKKINEFGEIVNFDLGFVGEVVNIDSEIINFMINNDYIPVISPIGADKDGQSYNINADYVAGAIAEALNADKFVLLTDVEGIFENYEDRNSLISSLNIKDVPELINKGALKVDGSKIECCMEALKNMKRLYQLMEDWNTPSLEYLLMKALELYS